MLFFLLGIIKGVTPNIVTNTCSRQRRIDTSKTDSIYLYLIRMAVAYMNSLQLITNLKDGSTRATFQWAIITTLFLVSLAKVCSEVDTSNSISHVVHDVYTRKSGLQSLLPPPCEVSRPVLGPSVFSMFIPRILLLFP